MQVICSNHAVKQMFQRDINTDGEESVLQHGIIISDYPDDKPYPSKLLFGIFKGRPLNTRPEKLNYMDCVICKIGSTKKGLVTFTLESNNVIVVFKNVPAMVCGNCGDFYLTSETTEMLLEKASKTVEKGVEIEVINFQPAA